MHVLSEFLMRSLLHVCVLFLPDPMMEVVNLEIPVNAVATLLKSFFSDLPDALIPTALCGELMEAAGEKLMLGVAQVQIGLQW